MAIGGYRPISGGAGKGDKGAVPDAEGAEISLAASQ